MSRVHAWCAIILIFCCTETAACHESPSVVTAQVIDLTNAVCSVVDGQPAGQPYVELACQLAQVGEQVVQILVGATAGDAGVAMSVPVTQVRIRLPASSAPAFLAAHKGPVK